MADPKREVTIVIPTFNRANYLRQAIDSALAQTYLCEIVVCDHGSSDDTPEVARSYGNKIKYVRREQDCGVHFTWLDGIMNASHDYIHLNFDDDWIAPTFIEETMNLFNDDVAFVFTAANIVFENNSESNFVQFKDFFKTGIHNKRILERYLTSYGSVVSPGCGIYRKSDLIDGLFIGNIPGTSHHYHGVGPDLLFSLLALLKYANVGFVNEPLAYFRAHEKSITINSKDNDTSTVDFYEAYNEAKKFFLIIKFAQKVKLGNILFWIQSRFLNRFHRAVIKCVKYIGK